MGPAADAGTRVVGDAVREIGNFAEIDAASAQEDIGARPAASALTLWVALRLPRPTGGS